MSADYKLTDDCKLTWHDDLQRKESDQAKFAVSENATSPNEGLDGQRCLTKKQRYAVLIAVLIILAISFVVLICLVVSARKTEPERNYCKAQPCKHGTCKEEDGEYTCDCFAGFTGLKCEVDINECQPNPCQHGRCSEGVDHYTCQCDVGFNGTNCENNIDDCLSSSCVHGVCLDGIDGYNCSCYHGYTGPNCQQDIDDCSVQPCVNGKCTDGVGSYECECFAGYNGTNCDQEILMDYLIGPVINESSTMYVNYTLVSGQQAYTELRQCAVSATDNQFLALRVDEVSGECERLTWDWGSDPQYAEGYAYLRKTKTVETFDPSFKIKGKFQWLLPGTFGVGGSVDLYISVPKGTQWIGFEMLIIDTTQFSFHTYDGDPEEIMVYVQFRQHRGDFASVHFKVWSQGWSNKLYMRKTSVADGNPHRFTFIPKATVMQILVDDTEVLEYTHTTDPATAKQFAVQPYSDEAIELHNITFVGI